MARRNAWDRQNKAKSRARKRGMASNQSKRESRRRNDPNWAEDLRNVNEDDWGTPKQQITLDMIAGLRPFTDASEEDGTSVPVSFRIPARVHRDLQRMMQRGAGRYDILTDLYRDVFTRGMLVIGYSLRLGPHPELLMAMLTHRRQQKKDIADQVEKVANEFGILDRDEQSDTLETLREIISAQPARVRRLYRSEIRKHGVLKDAYGR